MHNNTYISAKIKICNNIYIQSLDIKKILEDNKQRKYIPKEPKDGDCYAHLSTILLDSILVNSNNKHYPQIFL